MKVIIAGSRNITDYKIIEDAVKSSGFENITEIVSGGAHGVDFLGEQWALNNGLTVRSFPAEWAMYGKSAGMIRNKKMAEYGDGLIAVWDGESRGTQNMIENARKKNLPIYIHIVKPQ